MLSSASTYLGYILSNYMDGCSSSKICPRYPCAPCRILYVGLKGWYVHYVCTLERRYGYYNYVRPIGYVHDVPCILQDV